MDLSFAVHKLAKFSENTGKVHFEGLINLLRYIRDNNILCLKQYADLNYAPVHVSSFLTKFILLEMCLVCLVSLPFLAMHIEDLLFKTIKGASSGTISGS